ncbi:hypothetical protein PCL_07624 [Purpureocillium lilacinum]|uniref:Uncharacterized protein n=1 Tax=Purpureocillium lilacinum TaxID=33203 RepID=A0A2U3EIP0_PURLI|nr:hypothetical protein PCL_07624 [Purpureocillium lilacinum]
MVQEHRAPDCVGARTPTFGYKVAEASGGIGADVPMARRGRPELHHADAVFRQRRSKWALLHCAIDVSVSEQTGEACRPIPGTSLTPDTVTASCLARGRSRLLRPRSSRPCVDVSQDEAARCWRRQAAGDHVAARPIPGLSRTSRALFDPFVIRPHQASPEGRVTGRGTTSPAKYSGLHTTRGA